MSAQLQILTHAANHRTESGEDLVASAQSIAEKLMAVWPADFAFEGYRVARVKSNVGEEVYFAADVGGGYWEPLDEPGGGYLHGDFHAPIPERSDNACVDFLQAIRDGLLARAADALEKQALYYEALRAMADAVIKVASS
jgi:hypothetical protein